MSEDLQIVIVVCYTVQFEMYTKNNNYWRQNTDHGESSSSLCITHSLALIHIVSLLHLHYNLSL